VHCLPLWANYFKNGKAEKFQKYQRKQLGFLNQNLELLILQCGDRY
jgi:hypothetical protein